MSIARSRDFLLVGYALSRLTRADGLPPDSLNTAKWNEAYDLFFSALADGRSAATFRNSLKNARDSFDAHMAGSPRVGWRDPQNLENSSRGDTAIGEVLSEWSHRSDDEVRSLMEQLQESGDPANASGSARTEGNMKVHISRRAERDAALRAEAIDFHGLSCQVCGFNFERRYGRAGAGYIEVHHMVPLAEHGTRETDAATDLAILCANCHRMVHRRRGICLTLAELRAHIQDPEFVARSNS